MKKMLKILELLFSAKNNLNLLSYLGKKSKKNQSSKTKFYKKELQINQNILNNKIENVSNSLKNLDKLEEYVNLGYCVNLSKLANEGALDFCIGRDHEMKNLLEILTRKQRNNPILIGEPGVGKNSIVENLALSIAKKKAPSSLENKIVLKIRLSNIIADSKYRSDFEELFEGFLNIILTNEKNNFILYIDNISALTDQNKAHDSVDIANLLKSGLEDNIFQCITTATISEYNLFEKDLGIAPLFQQVQIKEPDIANSIKILQKQRSNFETYHNIEITSEAIKSAVTLSSKYFQSTHLPRKALDLIDQAGARKALTFIDVNTINNFYEKTRSYNSIKIGSSLIKKSNTNSLIYLTQMLLKNSSKFVTLKAFTEIFKNLLNFLFILNKKKKYFEINKIQNLSSENHSVRFFNDPFKTKLVSSGLSQNFYKKLKKELNFKQRKNFLISLINFLIPSKTSINPSKNKTILASIFKKKLVSDDVSKLVADLTGVPINSLDTLELQKLMRLEQDLKKRVIGQEEAISSIASAVRRSRIGIRNTSRPIASFLFCGPTGVGKTEITKALAEVLFGSEKEMIRFDMSEFMERHAVSRLIGAPPGYVGHESGGDLTNAVRQKPYSVVLFDEIEKAHIDILNILLQTLEDGRLTDSQKKLASFENTVIIMTSNAASSSILNNYSASEKSQKNFQFNNKNLEKKSARLDKKKKNSKKLYRKIKTKMLLNLGYRKKSIKSKTENNINNKKEAESKKKIIDELKTIFLPEFLNRIDDIIIFKPLNIEQLGKICDIMINSVIKRAKNQNLNITVTRNVKIYLTKKGYNPKFGARPLRRLITKYIEDLITKYLIEKMLKKNKKTVAKNSINITIQSGKIEII
jgi:ATP-dependent Clp protease ATP-binding subunit ClpB